MGPENYEYRISSNGLKSASNFRNIVNKFLPRIFFLELQPINTVVFRLPKIADHTVSLLIFDYNV